MKLHTDTGNAGALKVLISAQEKRKTVELKCVNHDARVVPYFERCHLPVLELADGQLIHSANTAASFLFGSSGDVLQQALVDEVLEWESTQFRPVVQAYLHAALTGGKPDVTNTKRVIASLQTWLAGKQYFVGSSLTCADVVVWSALFPFFNAVAPFKALRDENATLASWFDTLSQRDSFKKAVASMFGDKLKENLKASVQAQPLPLLPVERCGIKMAASASNAGSKPPKAQTTATTTTTTTAESTEPVVTDEERAAARDAWNSDRSKISSPRQRQHPILPQKGEKNLLITSALPYVNNVPHLGNIIGCVLSADVFSRFCRLRNYNCLYICGTDEYGTATETKAVEEGVTPQEICDKYNRLHREVYEWFNVDFDYFGRTTTKQQTKVAQDIFWELHKNGYILEDSMEQLKCEKCDRFLADRFVEGICPFCAFEDARGDQCDKCQKLINAIELREPRCKVCSSTPIVKTSSHLFLDLPKIEPKLVEYTEEHFKKGIFSHNTKVITRSWIRDGLKPRCITRDLKWGTPVPLKGYTEKVFYVWYDAPIGYISITANYTSDWEKWWKNPEQVELYNFMAKDNIPFHSVIFPCSLLGSTTNWTKVNHLSATEYLNYEDGKFSKSRGRGVFGNNAKDSGIPADIWRFYLLYLRPESQDSTFSWDDFVLKNNSELLNNLGNFINRALMFVNNTFKGVMPAVVLTPEDEELLALITRELKAYNENLDKISLRDGIRNMLSISRLGNQYIQANKPWVLVKGTDEEKIRGGSVIGLAGNIVCLLSVLVQPYMPEVSKEIQTQLNAPAECNVLSDIFVCYLPTGHQINKPSPLFQKIDSAKVAELKQRYQGKQETPPPAAAPAATAKAATAAPAASTPTPNPEEAARLTALVTEQGNVVRELKAAKAAKEKVDVEVKKLLDLKKQLSLAQGVDPAAAAPQQGGGKKKRGGKKK